MSDLVKSAFDQDLRKGLFKKNQIEKAKRRCSAKKKKMKTEFDRRCDRLEKQIANAGRDLMSRNDEPFINRSGKKVLGPFEAEISELRSMASTKVQKRRLKKAEDLLADLRSHWFGKAL